MRNCLVTFARAYSQVISSSCSAAAAVSLLRPLPPAHGESAMPGAHAHDPRGIWPAVATCIFTSTQIRGDAIGRELHAEKEYAQAGVASHGRDKLFGRAARQARCK